MIRECVVDSVDHGADGSYRTGLCDFYNPSIGSDFCSHSRLEVYGGSVHRVCVGWYKHIEECQKQEWSSIVAGIKEDRK